MLAYVIGSGPPGGAANLLANAETNYNYLEGVSKLIRGHARSDGHTHFLYKKHNKLCA